MLRNLLHGFVLMLFVLSFVSVASTQDKPDSAAQEEMMAKAMELAEPGEEHKMLEKLTGEWTKEVKMWMSPDAEAMVFSGSNTNKMLLGGRFLYGEYSTGTGAMSGEGFFVMGFDRRHEKFTYIGFDSWGTYSVSASGTYNEETKSITMYGEDDDPVANNTQKYDFVITFLSDDSWRFEVTFLDKVNAHGADSFKMVEVIYTLSE